MERMNVILNKFKEKKILVIGDIMLDTYLKGEVRKMSVEAPVPVVKIEQEFNTLGGAGNVASNIISLGGKATIFSFIGNDQAGNHIINLLEEKNIESYMERERKTIQKIRIIGNEQQIARADQEEISQKIFSDKTKVILARKSAEADIIIISDYAKGVINKDLIAFLTEFKHRMIIDPKPANKEIYKGAFLIKPNEKEVFDMTNVEDFEEACRKLKEELQSHILVTRGKKGMSLFSNNLVHIPTYAREVFNITGAGDTVIATLALSLASGASINEAAIISNHAAGITVEKEGTYSVGFSELMAKIFEKESKICSLEELKKIVDDLKKKNKKIVWTNGCFDLLHVGHTRYLKEAKKLGDTLIVGLNSDASVKKLKGEDRPIQTETERAEILSSLEFIDYVTIFPETTPTRYIGELKPHVYVKGGDYSVEQLRKHEEGKIIEEQGGEIIIVPLENSTSTSKILESIKMQKNGTTKKF
ncbi:D-glycero-beta-D-manno-heptose 1-phosphate adenylyltransferase [Candidatus Pacearchaeota archaeon]|nr:D-glycero-beta-D-manno-heptose 1-phosphate adenylyltransferase [Candidatus Pacearchaeota archaeon]